MLKKNQLLFNRIFWNFNFLIFIGILTFFSTSLVFLKNIEQFNKVFWFQIISIFFGYLILFLILNYKKINFVLLRKYSLHFLVITILIQFLVFIPGLGMNLNGASRWIHFGPISFQPSDLLRISLILFLANVFLVFPNILTNFKNFLKFFFGLIFSLVLIFVLIKDTGTLLITLVVITSMLLFTRIHKWKFILMNFVLLVVMSALIWFFVPHARDRLENFFHNQNRISDEFYQNYNMMVAIGSGGLTGVGYGESRQKFNQNIPEMISDSIFSVYAEEWGFLGSVVLILAYWILFLQIVWNLSKIRDVYTRYVVVGLSVNLFFPAFYNMAANLSVVPLSGFPLTFISKGGTNILISIISMALILLAYKKKY